MKLALIAALFVFSSFATHAYAAGEETTAPQGDVQNQSIDETTDAGLIPADQLDSMLYQTDEVLPEPPPPHPNPPHPPRPPRPRPHVWTCLARDIFRRPFWAQDFFLFRARREAMMACERRSFGCRLVGCQLR